MRPFDESMWRVCLLTVSLLRLSLRGYYRKQKVAAFIDLLQFCTLLLRNYWFVSCLLGLEEQRWPFPFIHWINFTVHRVIRCSNLRFVCFNWGFRLTRMPSLLFWIAIIFSFDLRRSVSLFSHHSLRLIAFPSLLVAWNLLVFNWNFNTIFVRRFSSLELVFALLRRLAAIGLLDNVLNVMIWLQNLRRVHRVLDLWSLSLMGHLDSTRPTNFCHSMPLSDWRSVHIHDLARIR